MTVDARTGDPTRLSDLRHAPELRTLLVEHAGRGYRGQSIVRLGLVAFTGFAVVLVPPTIGLDECLLIVAAYAVWAFTAVVIVRGHAARVLRMSWLAPCGDVAAVGALAVVASVADGSSSTAEALLTGMFLIPVLAAMQLRVWAAVTVIVPLTVTFTVCSLVVERTAREDWAPVPLQTMLLICVGVGCTLLVRVQASRVLALGRESMRRAALLAELLDTEARERTQLSEHLHDGAMQYVLAARQELDDLPADTDPVVAQRLREALGEALTLLRSQVAELSPAVLKQAGLVTAVQRLAEDQAARGRFAVDVDAAAWTRGMDPAIESLLFDAAREFLRNTVRHARATRVSVVLASDDSAGSVTVHDDGVGVRPGAVDTRLEAGHIGLATRRIRLEAAGGRLEIESGRPPGTTMRAIVPVLR
jgi:two-component system NarL family sensor kinase